MPSRPLWVLRHDRKAVCNPLSLSLPVSLSLSLFRSPSVPFLFPHYFLSLYVIIPPGRSVMMGLSDESDVYVGNPRGWPDQRLLTDPRKIQPPGSGSVHPDDYIFTLEREGCGG